MNNPADIESLHDHPAARCWAGSGHPGEAIALEVLQDETARAVYRLAITESSRARSVPESLAVPRPGGVTTVIAKRGPRADIAKEAHIYRDVLPRLGIAVLETYDLAGDEDPNYAWLLMADAGNRRYDPDERTHRVRAAEWLAALHVNSADLPRPPGLEDRGPTHFKPFVETALRTLEARHNIVSLGTDDRAVLDEIHEFCIMLTDRWSEIERFCAAMPSTLVHGDIKQDNLRIGGPPGRPELLVFDWHEGGWGPPALDLAKFLGYTVAPDFASYLRAWRVTWPGHDIGDLRRLGYVGEIFRWSASVRWHLDDFGYGKPERALARMCVYRDWMHEIERAAPWRDNSALRSDNWQPLKKYWS